MGSSEIASGRRGRAAATIAAGAAIAAGAVVLACDVGNVKVTLEPPELDVLAGGTIPGVLPK